MREYDGPTNALWYYDNNYGYKIYPCDYDSYSLIIELLNGEELVADTIIKKPAFTKDWHTLDILFTLQSDSTFVITETLTNRAAN